MTDHLATLPRIETAHGAVSIAKLEDIEGHPAWAGAFAHQRKDARYYEIVDRTIRQEFDYRYLVFWGEGGAVIAIQPVFLLDQDLLAGAGRRALAIAGALRRVLPRALTVRTLMVGCAAGEGHLGSDEPAAAEQAAQALHAALEPVAKQAGARIIVLKEFPAPYREALRTFAENGYTRVPSLPMTQLGIAYPNF